MVLKNNIGYWGASIKAQRKHNGFESKIKDQLSP